MATAPVENNNKITSEEICSEITSEEICSEINKSELADIPQISDSSDLEITCDIMIEINKIYADASEAMKQNPHDKDVLILYIEKLSLYKITFDIANSLDITYFNCNGGYWREAYNSPHVGDKIDDWVVNNIGLLTFDMSSTQDKLFYHTYLNSSCDNNNNNEEKYLECIRLIKFNSDIDKLQELLKNIDTQFLRDKDPSVTDWTKNHPRYLHLFIMVFAEGHPLFNTMCKIMEEHDIILSDYELLYCIIIGIFWRYYYDEKIINYAICELKEGVIYNTINHIQFTPEINYLLLNVGIENKYSYFRRCSNSLGYINGKWFTEPTIYNKECDMINLKYYYMENGFIYIDKEEIKKAFSTTASFIFKLKTVDTLIYDDYKLNPNWYCIIYDEAYYDEKYRMFVFMQGIKIEMFLKTFNKEYIIYSIDDIILKKLQDNKILPIL